MKRTMAVTVFIFLLIGACMLAGLSTASADERAKNCAVCHNDNKGIYPQGHVAVEGDGIEACRDCHGEDNDVPFDWIAHFNHVAKPEFKGDCQTCHQYGPDGKLMAFSLSLDIAKTDAADPMDTLKPYYQSWGKSEFLDHTHAGNKVTCRACHEQSVPEKGVTKEACLKCHGSYKELAEKADTHFIAMNPHFGDGQELDCSACHAIHKKPETICSKCHS